MTAINVTINDGIAFLPDGSEIKLAGIQELLEEHFRKTGDERFDMAAYALSGMTLKNQDTWAHKPFRPEFCETLSIPEQPVTEQKDNAPTVDV